MPGLKKYNDDRPRQAFELALLGATEQEIADFMEVDVSCIEAWKRERPEFLKSLREGKLEADAKVAHSLYKCAIGYDYTDEYAVLDRAGVPHKLTLKKHCKADPTAAVKWLSLRRRNEWADKQQIDVTHTSISLTKIDLSVLDTAELAVIRKVQLTQLSKDAGTN